ERNVCSRNESNGLSQLRRSGMSVAGMNQTVDPSPVRGAMSVAGMNQAVDPSPVRGAMSVERSKN
ncbi:MAG: hypothetical protein WD577_14215, partial [Bacteroidales bacterium]